MLYLVPTPIGNLEDITLRAINILREVDLVLCEDTRVTGKLMKHLEIKKPLLSFHTHNEHNSVESIIDKLRSDQKIALVSDAGSPGISDPGFLLVRACKQANIDVIALPGATAFVPALTASGLPCDKFFFEGFLPQKKGRATRLKYISELPYTVVLYESPFRIVKCLTQLIEVCGEERLCSVGRELTKIYEEVTTHTLKDQLEYYKSKPKVKGEIVLVLEGKK